MIHPHISHVSLCARTMRRSDQNTRATVGAYNVLSDSEIQIGLQPLQLLLRPVEWAMPIVTYLAFRNVPSRSSSNAL
jgi:hypothetical protein